MLRKGENIYDGATIIYVCDFFQSTVYYTARPSQPGVIKRSRINNKLTDSYCIY